MLSSSNNYSEKKFSEAWIGEKWYESEQGRLHGGGDTEAEVGISKEKEAERRAKYSRKTSPHGMGPHPGQSRGKGHPWGTQGSLVGREGGQST